MTGTRRRLVVAAALVAGAGALASVVQALREPPRAFTRARRGSAVLEAEGAQTADLSLEGGEYVPNLVHARAGLPLRIRVRVRERHGCATRFLVPDLGVDLALVAGETAEVRVPPSPPGEYLFTCAQKMVKGVLVLE